MASQWTGMQTTNYRMAVRVRLAVHSDVHQVTDLCTQRAAYTELEYLPHIYSQLINQKDIICFVAQFGKKIAGLLAVSLVDDTTVICCTHREADQLQRLGLSSMFKSLVAQVLKRNYPRLTRWTYSTQMDDQMTKMISNSHVQILDKWDVMTLQLDKTTLQLVISKLSDKLVLSTRTTELSISGVHELFSSGHVHTLVPGRRVYTGSYNRPCTLSSDLAKSLCYTHTVYTVTTEIHTRCQGFGTVYSHNCGEFISSYIRYYGDCQIDLLVAFILEGLLCIQRQAGCSGMRHVVEISFPSGVNQRDIEACLSYGHIKYDTLVYVNDEVLMGR